MIPTSVTSPGNITQSASSAVIGIASLILEGRSLSDDEFTSTPSQNPKIYEKSLPGSCFRLCRSFNATNNPPSSAVSTSFKPNSNESTAHSSLLHIQRLRQKLGQLRQSSPGTSRGDHFLSEQAIMIGLNKCSSNSMTPTNNDDDELVEYIERRQPKQQSPTAYSATDNKPLNTLQSLATTCLRTAPRPNKVMHDLGEMYCNTSGQSVAESCVEVGASYGFKPYASSSHHKPDIFTTKTMKNAPTRSEEKCSVAAPKQGPHCDNFLRKVGLTKIEAMAEFEEHICDMANLNEICYRWQLHCRQIDCIMSRTDPICIEVFLGPENHEILLEQWIIQQIEKSTAPIMTIQSLSNAIRSQLYFSQITAWTDLIKNAKPYDREIMDHVRVIKGSIRRKPRLDILYRIKAYDSTACFNSKPNVHDFPNIVISENCSISVCLKSLPRIQSGIPKIEDSINTSCSSSSSCTYPLPVSCGSSECSTDQSNSSLDESMVLDDRLNLPCQEKGKHKCAFDEEYGNSDAAIEEAMSNSDVSHREKQLLKYRKRMMKRDKKKTSASTSKSAIDVVLANHSHNHHHQQHHHHQQPMQLEDKPQHNEDMHSEGANQQQTIHEFGSINSIRPPLYQTQHSKAEAVQTNSVEMVSVGTQTANFPMLYPNCETCGNEMELVCIDCDIKSLQCTPPHSSCPQSTSSSTPKMGKGDILLQAIERTPRHKFHDVRYNNNNNTPSLKTLSKSKTNDCQLCKRQKTQHHYRERSGLAQNQYKEEKLAAAASVDSHMSSECACRNEYAVNCCTNKSSRSNALGRSQTPTETMISNEFKLSDDIDAQFKTPKTHFSPRNMLKPTPLYINCSEKLPPSKSIPKINLSSIFNNSSCSPSSSAPIAISTWDTFNFDNILSPDIPVQKSNSAPTLPNSPSLSPRFLKQAAIYKRRARHLSDRSSERSSIGSDEQYSDEDLESLYSPTSSPIKSRMFLKSSGFGRRPFLGSFEESLLQKRFVPKSQVAGFKVLLGASGGFCPTQLTIPAVASFYELSSGSSMSTPYVCEIRLSRKGYTVPRVGTVQATLLNPLGTVVRMFVIPYDFRDMPAMSQTFIRQRILAVDSSVDADNHGTNRENSSSGLGHSDMSFGEQMRSLRYAIHLRFQTSRSGRLALHTDIRLLISRRTDCDTAAAHAKRALESPNELRIVTIKPDHPKYSSRHENPNKI